MLEYVFHHNEAYLCTWLTTFSGYIVIDHTSSSLRVVFLRKMMIVVHKDIMMMSVVNIAWSSMMLSSFRSL